MRARSVVPVALLASIAMFATACGNNNKNNAATTTTNANVPKGGTLVIGAEQEPDCLDFIASCSGSTWGDYMVKEQTIPSAFVFPRDSSGNYSYKYNALVLSEEPKLETSPVQKITYKINPKAVWSDGVAISSSDFKYTWDQIANGTDVYDKTGYDLIQGVDDSDPHTAVVTFKQGKTFSDWKNLFTANYGIWPSHILQGKDRDAETKDGYAWSGGPWMLEGGAAGWVKTDHITLVPNPKYWGPKPNLDKVIFKVQADTSAEFTAFKSKQTSMIWPQPQLDAVDQINAGLPGVSKDIASKTGNFEALWLNNGVFPFNDVAVRQAAAYALDRAAIVQRLFGGLGVKQPLQDLNGPIVNEFTDAQAYAKYTLNLDKVNSLLTADGWAKGSDGIWAKNGQKLSFKVRTTAGNKRRETTEQILQTQFKAAGMDMQVDNLKAGDLFGQALPKGDFQAAIYAQVLTSLQASTCNLFCSKNMSPIGQSGGNNYTRTNIPSLDEQLTKTDQALNDSDLAAAGKAASKISADNVISIPIDPLPTILLWDSTKIVGHVEDNALQGPFWNMNTWGVKS
ncbi:MAG TPA: ABC transporter substrate-binding protein [Acidimicrobiales bacterium]|nr:ABC transporter substrate-binding protein [Acidimicrobiales bacterium]